MTLPEARSALRASIDDVRRQHQFCIDGWVLLPHHLHCIWTLPEGDNDFSKRWGLIKAGFTKRTKLLFHNKAWMNESKSRKRESTIWQRRFWEHEIRDDRDYRIHMDYLHFNPVKHDLVKQVIEWPYSTFHRYMDKGVYPKDWGGGGVEFREGFGSE